MVIGSICGFIFILIQLILLIDFAHSWNENWVAKGEEGSKAHYAGLIFFTATFYIASLVAIILLYVFYASKPPCNLNIFFVTLNLFLCIIVSIVSVLPAVQSHHPTSGLLQSSFVTLYVVFLTWSAMTSEESGNTGLEGKICQKKSSSSQIRYAIQHGKNSILWILRRRSSHTDMVLWVFHRS